MERACASLLDEGLECVILGCLLTVSPRVQVVLGIRAIKLYSWEEPFVKRIMGLRLALYALLCHLQVLTAPCVGLRNCSRPQNGNIACLMRCRDKELSSIRLAAIYNALNTMLFLGVSHTRDNNNNPLK